jgi:hypothetical protein
MARYSTKRSTRWGIFRCRPTSPSKREDDDARPQGLSDHVRAHEGSVAAPTAGLHFTDALEEARGCNQAGIGVQRVTLHVGAGTFLPVKVDDTVVSQMHAEYGVIRPRGGAMRSTRREPKAAGVIAVGTTALRLLESAATSESGEVKPFAGETAIFITPGYRFRAVDALLTNFHLPRSTLFMLVSAFAGLERMKRAYAHAIANGYRFYSYGDASLLFPERRAKSPPMKFNHCFWPRRRGAPRRRLQTSRGVIRTPAFMPVGTAGDREGMLPRNRALDRRRYRARQRLPSDAAAGRRARSRARRPAQIHELGRGRS